jgi:WD40 repeat protein
MRVHQVPKGGVSSLVFSSDGATIYTGDGGGWVSAWNRATGEQRKLFQLKDRHASDIWRLAVTKDDRLILAATPNSFKVWDASTGAFWPSRPALGSTFESALASDDRTLAAVKEHRSIVFFDLSVRGPHPSRSAVRIPDMVTDLTFSPADGTLGVVDMDGGLYLLEAGADRPFRINSEDEDELIEYSDWCRYLVFSADGKTLATCGSRSILLWDVPARQLRRRIKAGRSIVRQLAFHPDGRLLASGGDTPAVTVWDVTTGKEVHRYDWGIGTKILSLAFAPDGMTAVAGGSNRKFVVWDLDV